MHVKLSRTLLVKGIVGIPIGFLLLVWLSVTIVLPRIFGVIGLIICIAYIVYIWGKTGIPLGQKKPKLYMLIGIRPWLLALLLFYSLALCCFGGQPYDFSRD